MPGWRIGHTALTWNVLSDPPQLEAVLRDCAELGYAGTETGGRTYDWWARERPGELERLLGRYGVKMACLFHSGAWTEKAQAASLVEDGRRWAEALSAVGGEVLMVVPGGRRPSPPYTHDAFQIMADAMNETGRRARETGSSTST